jgi:hypothetical protein
MQCSGCGSKGYTVVKCDNCEEIRCTKGGCKGTAGGRPGSGNEGIKCIACRKGKYVKVN